MLYLVNARTGRVWMAGGPFMLFYLWISGLISPANVNLLWENNIISWLINSNGNERTNRLFEWSCPPRLSPKREARTRLSVEAMLSTAGHCTSCLSSLCHLSSWKTVAVRLGFGTSISTCLTVLVRRAKNRVETSATLCQEQSWDICDFVPR